MARSGVNTYLMKGFFDTIPVEIDESARIDGASHVRIFFGMILRLAAPILTVVFFITFTGMFNELAIASVIVPNQLDTTLAVGLNTYVSNPLKQEWGYFAAGALMAAVPMLIVFAIRPAPAGHRPHRRGRQGLTRAPMGNGSVSSGSLLEAPHHDGSPAYCPDPPKEHGDPFTVLLRTSADDPVTPRRGPPGARR